MLFLGVAIVIVALRSHAKHAMAAADRPINAVNYAGAAERVLGGILKPRSAL